MANAKEAFPSTFLKADDVANPQSFTIKGVVMVYKFQDGSSKPLVEFTDGKQLVCNKTNWNVLIELLGDDTDKWLGKTITLARQMVDFRGERTPALRILANGNGHAAPPPPPQQFINPVAAMKTWIAKGKMNPANVDAAQLAEKVDELAGMAYGASVPDLTVEAMFASGDAAATLAAMWVVINEMISHQGDVNI